MSTNLKAVTPAASADSAIDALAMNIGAIGDLLRVAGANENQSLQPLTVAQVGDLICSMSAEILRLQEGA